jgi:hypothetical protein
MKLFALRKLITLTNRQRPPLEQARLIKKNSYAKPAYNKEILEKRKKALAILNGEDGDQCSLLISCLFYI